MCAVPCTVSGAWLGTHPSKAHTGTLTDATDGVMVTRGAARPIVPHSSVLQCMVHSFGASRQASSLQVELRVTVVTLHVPFHHARC